MTLEIIKFKKKNNETVIIGYEIGEEIEKIKTEQIQNNSDKNFKMELWYYANQR